MRFRYTAAARREIAEILSYIGQDNPMAAIKIADEIETTVVLLSRHPRVGPIVYQEKLRARMLGRFRYRIFYTIEDDELVIRNVRSTRRRLPWQEPGG